MARYTTTVTSPATPQAAYDYLADFRTITDWDPSVTSAELVSGTAGEEGSRYRVALGVGPLGYPMEYVTVSAKRPDSDEAGSGEVQLRAENAHVVSHDTITFTPDGSGGTTITYDAQLLPKGIRRYADPVFSLMIGFFGTRARGGLQDAVAALPTGEAA